MLLVNAGMPLSEHDHSLFMIGLTLCLNIVMLLMGIDIMSARPHHATDGCRHVTFRAWSPPVHDRFNTMSEHRDAADGYRHNVCEISSCYWWMLSPVHGRLSIMSEHRYDSCTLTCCWHGHSLKFFFALIIMSWRVARPGWISKRVVREHWNLLIPGPYPARLHGPGRSLHGYPGPTSNTNLRLSDLY